jgi:hypothetical protein
LRDPFPCYVDSFACYLDYIRADVRFLFEAVTRLQSSVTADYEAQAEDLHDKSMRRFASVETLLVSIEESLEDPRFREYARQGTAQWKKDKSKSGVRDIAHDAEE